MKRQVIIVLGTDGAGKSTLCDRLLERLPEPRNYIYFGLRESRLGFVRKHYQKRGDMQLWARIFMFSFDYLLRRRALPEQGYLLLDRLPGWAIVSPNPLIRWLYGYILPPCDTLILCSGEAKKIVARKPERTLEGCVKDLEKWQQVFDAYPAGKKISLNTTVNNIDTCLELAINAVSNARP